MKLYKIAFPALGILLMTAGVSSCSLDKEVDLTLQNDVVFGNEDMTRGFLANCYTYLPDAFADYSDGNSRLNKDCMTDNAVCYWRGYTQTVMDDAYDATNHWYANNFWNSSTAGIRACNQFMKNARPEVVGNADRTGDENHLYDRYIAEARALRALLHFQMVEWFGDCPIIGDGEDGVPMVLTPSDVLPERKPAHEVLKWIADECDALKSALPFRYSDEEQNWGRFNGAAVYALKSRVLLYRASPLYNTLGDASYWTQAAQAAQDFITANNASPNPYRLHTTSDNDPKQNYYDCFVTNPVHNNEYMLSRSVWRGQTAIEDLNSPCGFTGKRSATGYMNPSQNLADAYETIKGLPIDQDPDYDPQNPYVNRDPRMEQTLLHHGSVWGVAEEERLVDVNNDEGRVGIDYNRSNGGTCTGYYLKKYTTNIPWDGTVRGTDKACPIFRYAEILLNAAEALNEAGQSNEAAGFVNQVRARVGMPALSGLTKDQLRERIRNERRIELCFEDHRYFDVRRWKLFDEYGDRNAEASNPRYRQLRTIYGVRVTENQSVKFTYRENEKYPYMTFNSPKNYFVPIPHTEVVRTGYKQNPGWEL